MSLVRFIFHRFGYKGRKKYTKSFGYKEKAPFPSLLQLSIFQNVYCLKFNEYLLMIWTWFDTWLYTAVIGLSI